MSINDYQSELYPVGPELQDYDWGKAFLLRSQTETLRKEYDRLSEELKKLRDKEPPKKRGKKSTYRSWVRETHDLIDLLKEIERELCLRLNRSNDL